jgi:hypothetical protein
MSSAPPPAYGVHLTRTEENVAEVDALAARWPRVGLGGVLAGLDRRMLPCWAPGRRVRRALAFDRRDQGDRNWYPQGIASSSHTGVARDVLLVSWYAKDRSGTRVSVIDLESRRYRHLRLVEPTSEGGIRPVQVHAGGLVWQAPYLHVAATRRGFLTFHLDDVLAHPDGPLLPVRYAYRAAADEGVERLRYSFLALDRSGETPALVVGEYGRRGQTTRLAHFGVDAVTGALHADAEGVSRPLRLLESGTRQAQGVAIVDGVAHVTVSHGPWGLGDLRVGSLEGPQGSPVLRKVRWATPMGPEDLTWWEAHTDSRGRAHPGRLWSVSEHPWRRWVFALKPAADGG